MDFQLYFCADGILRAKLNNDKPMIPVKFLHENGSNSGNDLRFWARWWESTVHFEEGLTVGKFLSCLEPWTDFWTDFTGKNVGEYIKESRRPIAVKEKEDKEKPLDWVSLSYYTEVSPSSEYDKNDDDDNMFDDINKWLNTPKNTRLTGEWEIYSAYKLSGFALGESEQYSVDYSPMNELANLPIILNDKQILHFCSWKLEQILGEGKDHFFQKEAFGLCSFPEGMTQFIIGDKSHNMRDVIEGFFWWLHSTPAIRNDFVSEILDRKMEIDEAIDEDIEEESNVVSLFPRVVEDSDDENEEIQNKDSEGKPKKMKVKIANGAFSSMADAFSRDKSYWEEMLELAAKENNVVLKIGKTKEAKVPEKRVFSYIIKDENDSAVPKPSSYKLR